MNYQLFFVCLFVCFFIVKILLFQLFKYEYFPVSLLSYGTTLNIFLGSGHMRTSSAGFCPSHVHWSCQSVLEHNTETSAKY